MLHKDKPILFQGHLDRMNKMRKTSQYFWTVGDEHTVVVDVF